MKRTNRLLSSYTCYCVGLYSILSGYFSRGRMVPVPLSVKTVISLGSRVKLNCWGRRLWFSSVTVNLEAAWLNRFPKSTLGGWKVTAFTVNTHFSENLTGSTWLAPVTLIGMRIVNSSYSSLGASSFCLTKKRLHVCKMLRSGFNLAQISKWPFPWIKPSVGLNSRYGLKSLG